MSRSEFLFASLNSKSPDTSRKVHIRRLYDVMQLCIQRGDYGRARKAWAILARCKEIHWKAMWTTAVLLLMSDKDGHAQNEGARTIDFLRSMMLRYPEEKQTILRELVLRLIQAGRYNEALDELDLYLPSFPYQDNPVLHAYAGLICLYLSQPQGESHTVDTSFLRTAKTHLERSKILDPDNTVVQGFLEKASNSQNPQVGPPDSDDENTMNVDSDGQPRKRVRA
ncbi:hypothetical protein GLOTRDRAFT_125416 [Gloeophyllum trabeum ATCC 11539]|uniref:TPR-like protein n=1 Tax=Gloeophyllum trabeum (strain ATCC 11539 / FP-39264 / Madison 617) TaxID=670483 RepID=S7QH34_GLOTA|nr:uncharacterized protein GLOTRDRAFT_125416 [Gloeophyllum trabeum ATCC 11539]EPQ59106.1 hypothetical protein GLOTRDRAFT_125416 [Gloeophyllum trabeum ATCC 11539]